MKPQHLIWLFFALCYLIIYFFDFNGLYGQDAHEYYRYSKALLNYFKAGINPGDYFWPVWYPLLGAFISFFTHINLLFVLQFVSVISFLLTIILVSVISKEALIQDSNSATFAILTVGLSPLMMINGLVVMSDMMSLVLVLFALYSYKKFYDFNSARWAIVFVVTSVIATMTRYACFVILIIPSIFLIFSLIKRKQYKYLLLSVFSGLIFVIPHVLIRINSPLGFVKHSHILNWSSLNYFRSSFDTADGATSYYLPNILYAFSNILNPQFSVFFLVLMFFVRRNDFKSVFTKIMLSSIIVYAVFLAGVPFQNKRFLILSFPLISAVLYPAFLRFIQLVNLKIIFLVIIPVQSFLFYNNFKKVSERNQLEKKWANVISQTNEKYLYTFDIDIGMRSYDTSKTVFNLWLKQYDSFQTPSLLLFNENKFKEQWKGHIPMINYNFILEQYELEPLISDKYGWELKKIKSRK